MDTTETAGPSSADTKYLTVRQAAFIGVGAMVGAGIFALLGAAGEVAGAAVWLSFLIAGFVAVLQGYSFAKLGARYPSAGGLLEYVAKATGNGHFTGITRLADVPGQRDRDGHGGGVVRELRRLDVRRREPGVDQVLRGGDHPGDDRGERGRVRAGGRRADGDRLRRARDIVGVRGGHAGEHHPVAAGAVEVPAVPGHHLVRGADLLRLPRLRHHHVHRQGPGQARPASCRGRCTWRWASRRSSTWPSHSACSARSPWTR